MPGDELPAQPSLLWRGGSAFIVGATGLLCRSFLLGLNKLEVHGWDKFSELLKSREDVEGRQRGLITVSNHLSVLDDPLIWGCLPYSMHWRPDNNRWSLASHDLAFPNKPLTTFFSLGNTLPAHRLAHSSFGGLFQPTMTQAIRLLSSGPFKPTRSHPFPTGSTETVANLSDPFSDGALQYTTNGTDSIPAPSAYASRRYAWVHIFPEGKIHQHPNMTMRYFKWGVARLILEADTCPDVVPMWIQGFDQIMHESRQFPRFLPRIGKSVSVTFGNKVDTESTFGDLRERWRELKERVRRKKEHTHEEELGVIWEDELRTGEEAVKLREECTMRVRQEVLKLRISRGLSEEDPKASLVETWRQEGDKNEGRMADGSWVKDT
ncbi:hypothetical protein K461DRAFT_245377 [Myriangium duriaei CBS 260.36]|uniref:Tafazzin family protein n=1 Tax=Myriangium duriaei CBS 260.36 TaxID=1168546 RepID=A0A9P4MHJ3_9PEZI|nr:hypothetical protein K461DRAFT_245377 [Myriangium duriaei CBS 260.36]